jgi:glycosyltransferase involved in cell wall biosynthesis
MRVAIVHYWLLNMRGGEKVLEALCRLLPGAHLFTLFYDPDAVSPFLNSHRITASFLNPLRRWHRNLLPLMPAALETLDLRGYDLVVSSESGPAKGVIVPTSARHVCYCHSPMRYLWDLYPDYLHDWMPSRWKRAAMIPISTALRTWDYASAARVDRFAANSESVRKRIWRAWRREADVVYPPVSVESFGYDHPENYYLLVGEMVAYKRFDLAVRWSVQTGRRLRVVGEGPEYRRLRSLAAANVEFCGRVSDSQLRDLYGRCRALIVPGEEDFGMTAVEAIASGKSVIALRRGGTVEAAGPHGFYFPEPTVDSLDVAVESFEAQEASIRPVELMQFASRFSEAEFRRRMAPVLASQPEPLRSRAHD